MACPDVPATDRPLADTRSLCPVCFERVPARYVSLADTVYLEKTCPSHGYFRTRVWQGADSFAQWIRPKIPIAHRFHMTPKNNGCPFDCGLCPGHRQQTCTAVLDVTRACNLSCTFCYADSMGPDSPPEPDMPFERIAGLLSRVHQASPGCNLQISGGEPTLRPDLPRIVATARETGFGFVQLNTNGIRLARDPALARQLKSAGLSSVFLQFDAVCDTVYEALRKNPLYRIKQAAVRACIRNGIGVILVPTLVPGVNMDQIGPILGFALDHFPGVRGVHFHPVSYFGRYRPPAPPPNQKQDQVRITLPDVLDQIQAQTGGTFRKSTFKPAACEHAQCSFSGKFLVGTDKTVRPVTKRSAGCCPPIPAEQGANRARNSVAGQWCCPSADLSAGPPGTPDTGPGENSPPPPNRLGENGLDAFIRQARTRMFSVSAMAFQDAWNLDLERLKGCCIHSVAPDGRLVPFCAYNLTRADGKGLYRKP